MAQSIDTRFGKNRVQYHDDFRIWDKYETENFIIHWYGKARNVAETVVPIAEYYHNEVAEILEHRMNDKIQILVYTDVSDLNQSNIGNDETWTSKSGETKIVGNKMFVYFDGNHQNLKTQIKEGIASVYMASMLFGSNFQEIVQNAVLLHVPEWFKKGIIAYAGSPWNLEVEDELRDIWQKDDKYHNFEKIANDYPTVAGHSMWYFISQYYSTSSIPNILYLTKISRDLEEAFVYVLSEQEKSVHSQWSVFFDEYFSGEDGRYVGPEMEDRIDLKNKDYVPVSKLRSSPDGRYLAYAYNDIGEYRLIVRNLESGEEKTIFNKGYKNALQETDYNYPIFTWHPNSEEITFAYEYRDVIKLRRISLSNDEYIEQIIPEEYQRLYEMDYLDEEHYLFNASTEGFSDLFIYNAKFRNTEKRITDDFFDDLDARVIEWNGRRGVLFSSNREESILAPMEMDTVLPLGKYDIYFYELKADNNRLERVTETDEVNERYPVLADKQGRIAFVADKNGIRNTYTIDPLSGRSYAVSNLGRNIILHEQNARTNTYFYMAYFDGGYEIFEKQGKNWSKPVNTSITPNYQSKEDITEVLVPLIQQEKEVEEMKEGYKFVTEFDDPENLDEVRDDGKEVNFYPDMNFLSSSGLDKERDVIEFNSARVTASRLTFRLDNFTTKMDNQVLFEGLESYTGEPDQINYNPNGILVKGTVKDLLEDYSIEGGVRIPTTFDGSEYFLVFDNKKSLLDKRYAFYRKVHTDFTNENVFPPQNSKKNSLIGLYQLKYPFDVYRSLRMTTTLRFDRYYFQSVENQTFESPINNEKRLGLKFEYVYDNTIDIDDNIMHGTRYKVYVEGINRFNFELTDGFNVDLHQAYTGIFGFDFRHYIPLLEHSIIALRGTAAASFGSEKLMYYLGGVNGWLFQKFNDKTPVPAGNFAFKTAVNQMRGFDLNVRNGSTYALTNAEIRIPLFKYFFGKNIKSGFLRNLQLVGFFDAGTAWHGSSPFSDDNPINSFTVTSEANGTPIVEVTVDYFRDPLVMGYGTGLRAKLLGYNLKFDYAWGIETRMVQKPKLYISLGTDF